MYKVLVVIVQILKVSLTLCLSIYIHFRFGKKARPAMYDATTVAYEDYSPDDKPLVTLIKTKDL